MSALNTVLSASVLELPEQTLRERLATLRAMLSELTAVRERVPYGTRKADAAAETAELTSTDAIERMFDSPPADLRQLNIVTLRAAAAAAGFESAPGRGKTELFKQLLAMRQAPAEETVPTAPKRSRSRK
jgi:hypothetical protein